MNDFYNKKVLGIDYGTKRIGLAISYGMLAEPLQIISNFSAPKEDDVISESALEQIINIISDEKIVHIVLGLSENKMAEKIKFFSTKLEEKMKLSPAMADIKIEFFDETLSSNEVHTRLSHKGIKYSKKTAKIDHYSASLILEEWLDSI